MLKTGNIAPLFTLQDNEGKEFHLENMIGKKKMVLYFYPKNETPGCTKEACSFRDQYEDFLTAGAEVIGVSGDSVRSHQKFISNRKLPYILLSDPGKKVHKLYDVGSTLFGLLSERITYVIDKKGVIQHAFNSQGQISRHVGDALKVLQKLD